MICNCVGGKETMNDEKLLQILGFANREGIIVYSLKINAQAFDELKVNMGTSLYTSSQDRLNVSTLFGQIEILRNTI